ncbi:hypothetical protein FF38_02921 [Lucilia cuprina]|uniref:Uncharacterized protein n=1 Tax=Lucilia cuprina TaxID=7375 RepID=A0A0L0BQR9_LUCCU|nr:hypothetical protein FF38_02921 [Lucilia cuprina]
MFLQVTVGICSHYTGTQQKSKSDGSTPEKTNRPALIQLVSQQPQAQSLQQLTLQQLPALSSQQRQTSSPTRRILQFKCDDNIRQLNLPGGTEVQGCKKSPEKKSPEKRSSSAIITTLAKKPTTVFNCHNKNDGGRTPKKGLSDSVQDAVIKGCNRGRKAKKSGKQ